MASIQLSSDAASALADAITTLVDAGSGAGSIKVYTGTLPTDLDPTGDTLLATFTLADPAAAAAVAGVATWDMTPAIDATIAADGTPGYFIVFDSDDTAVFGGDVATSAATMTASSTTWVSGGTATLNSGSVTAPDA